MREQPLSIQGNFLLYSHNISVSVPTARMGGSSRQESERNRWNQVPIGIFSLLIKYVLTRTVLDLFFFLEIFVLEPFLLSFSTAQQHFLWGYSFVSQAVAASIDKKKIKFKDYLGVFMALGIIQVTYSNRKFCPSVGPGFATLGTSR